MRVALPLLVLLLLLGCPDPEPPLPAGPPVALAYEAACDTTHHRRLVTLEGTLHLFPRLLSCYPDEDARTGRSCQVKLLPDRDAPTGSVEIERAYPTLFIDEGDRPGEARARGYGFGGPLTVFAADSIQVDPYDRVRVTGRLYARTPPAGGDGLLCTLDVQDLAIAEAAVPSWADEREAEAAALRARVDSSRAAYDSVRAAHGHADSPDSTDG